MKPRSRVGLLASAVFSSYLLLSACSRHAEIFDEPDAGITTGPGGPMRDKPFLPVDAGAESMLPACSERSEGTCRGPNDFPCDFGPWLDGVLQTCRTVTDCRPNGWIAAEIGDDGCFLRLEVTEPNSIYTNCVIERMREVHCPCSAQRVEEFLGTRNAPCSEPMPKPCLSGEFVCNAGEICVNGLCVPGGAGGAP